MARTESKPAAAAVKRAFEHPDMLRERVRGVLQEFLDAEMDEALPAGKSERTPQRIWCRRYASTHQRKGRRPFGRRPPL